MSSRTIDRSAINKASAQLHAEVRKHAHVTKVEYAKVRRDLETGNRVVIKALTQRLLDPDTSGQGLTAQQQILKGWLRGFARGERRGTPLSELNLAELRQLRVARTEAKMSDKIEKSLTKRLTNRLKKQQQRREINEAETEAIQRVSEIAARLLTDEQAPWEKLKPAQKVEKVKEALRDASPQETASVLGILAESDFRDVLNNIARQRRAIEFEEHKKLDRFFKKKINELVKESPEAEALGKKGFEVSLLENISSQDWKDLKDLHKIGFDEGGVYEFTSKKEFEEYYMKREGFALVVKKDKKIVAILEAGVVGHLNEDTKEYTNENLLRTGRYDTIDNVVGTPHAITTSPEVFVAKNLKTLWLDKGLSSSGAYLQVDATVVVEDYRNQGIGSSLKRIALKIAEDICHVDGLLSEIHGDNIPSLRTVARAARDSNREVRIVGGTNWTEEEGQRIGQERYAIVVIPTTNRALLPQTTIERRRIVGILARLEGETPEARIHINLEGLEGMLKK